MIIGFNTKYLMTFLQVSSEDVRLSYFLAWNLIGQSFHCETMQPERWYSGMSWFANKTLLVRY